MTVDSAVESRVGSILLGLRMVWLVLVSKKFKKVVQYNVNISSLYGHSQVIVVLDVVNHILKILI